MPSRSGRTDHSLLTCVPPSHRQPELPVRKTDLADFHELYTQPRHEHRDPPTVLLILLAEQLDHIPLFQSDSNQNVGRRHHGEQKVSRGHCWRRPECDDEAEIVKSHPSATPFSRPTMGLTQS